KCNIVNDLHGLMLEDHNRLRAQLSSAVADPDDHAVGTLIRSLVIHEAVEEAMLGEVAHLIPPDLVRHTDQAALDHHSLRKLVDALRGLPSAATLLAVERDFLVHLDHEERVLLPA